MVKFDLPELHVGAICRQCQSSITVRIKSDHYKDNTTGKPKRGLSWISVRCKCGAAVLYWNGVFRIIPADYYNPEIPRLREEARRNNNPIKIKGDKDGKGISDFTGK